VPSARTLSTYEDRLKGVGYTLFSIETDALGAGLNAKQRAMLGLALSFFTWRTLAREGGLKQAAVVAAMAQAVESAG